MKTTANKIEDFGQKIGGARKDIYQAALEQAEKFINTAQPGVLIKAKSLGALVKLPNLESLSKAGAVSADNVRAIFVAWRSIDRRPTRYGLSRWASATAPKLARIGELLQGADLTDEERTAAEFRTLEAAGWPSVAFSFGSYSVRYVVPPFEYRTPTPSDPLRVVGGTRYRCAATYNPADIVAALRQLIEADARKRAEGPALTANINRAGQWYIHPDGKREICLKTYPAGTDAADIRRALREDRPQLLERLAALRAVPELRRDWNRPRVGNDWRRGADVSPEAYSAALPFRGVEFGNWVSQTERAALLNSAFDGFHDLAQVLTIAPAAVTLGGSLAFAFASRGHSSAMAHYEPGRRVINLTKKNGAGCMAHEWFHAVDHYAAYSFAKNSPENIGGLYCSESFGGQSAAVVAGAAIVRQIRQMDFYRRSEQMAAVKSGDYWTQGRELAARGFEGVCAYLLKRAGICSDFLVNCKSMDEFTAADPCHRSEIYPYPTEQEAAQLAPLYFDFFRAVFGPDCCQVDADTVAEIEQHTATATAQKAEADARRAEQAEKEQAERVRRARELAERMAEARRAAEEKAEQERQAAEQAAQEQAEREAKAGRIQQADKPAAADDAAPAEGLTLCEMPGGVYVAGDSRTTYRNRRAIKSHGATWDKEAQRWQATTAEAVAQLRAWFGVADDAATVQPIEEPAAQSAAEPSAQLEQGEAVTTEGTPAEQEAATASPSYRPLGKSPNFDLSTDCADLRGNQKEEDMKESKLENLLDPALLSVLDEYNINYGSVVNNGNEYCVELEFYSKHGGDQIVALWFDKNNPNKSFAEALKEYREGFDVDEYVKKWLNAKESWPEICDLSARQLVEDGEDVLRILSTLIEKVNLALIEVEKNH